MVEEVYLRQQEIEEEEKRLKVSLLRVTIDGQHCREKDRGFSKVVPPRFYTLTFGTH